MKLRATSLLGPVAGVVLAAVMVMGGVFVTAERYYLNQLAEEAGASIELQRENLAGWLGRFRALPSVYSRHPALLAALDAPDDGALRDRLNILLESWTYSTGAEESYLLGIDGRVLASSSGDTRAGRNMGHRPHHFEAMQGRLGRWFEVDARTRLRGYHFSFPVWRGSEVAGVVVVTANVGDMEDELRLSPDEVFVTDARGLVVLSGHPDLRLTQIGSSRDGLVVPVAGLTTDLSEGEFELVRGRADRSDRKEQEFVHLVRPVATEGWMLHLLAASAQAHTKAYVVVALSGLIATVIALAGLLVGARGRLLHDRLLAGEREGRLLERKVAMRTADLSAANQSLAREVRDRSAAEAELRQTQNDLVQAGKLAVLGQMSTALSHEFNQPLTAIRSYAENATAFVEQGREDRARENLERIMRLTARMAQLSRRLSNFARKPAEGMQDVALTDVFDEALGLMAARLTRAGVKPRITGLRNGLTVRAGAIRLQHVLMNLIGNALDATEDTLNPAIDIDIREDENGVNITVSDNGPGVPEELRESIFDPFFTTKEVGRGVGLGLSISYNIIRDFGGRIRVGVSDQGGARFCIRLASTDEQVAVE
ncbi:two-component system, NtrC family, C4-dicarboxylate transport sensor histidine kinase DctB [Monaibacterium marinum]|uniref:C4-dicarboxylate transport sensor protein DctB n=1 Tax=Pontivivens marinum TaxID=1690039 RepID=A0A2C9CLW4_9RHOB|nr:ATP-binding protein [Monaibacterium marinum]SOH92232.1 two-component system, NtrC family, C4-dicarboxylate transport sensor histidine kinase DctB [Monaibacterium marinum]